MSNTIQATASTELNETGLFEINTGRKIVFPGDKPPSLRAFNGWKQKGYFPSVKIGKRVFINPEKVRQALEARFTINAN